MKSGYNILEGRKSRQALETVEWEGDRHGETQLKGGHLMLSLEKSVKPYHTLKCFSRDLRDDIDRLES